MNRANVTNLLWVAAGVLGPAVAVQAIKLADGARGPAVARASVSADAPMITPPAPIPVMRAPKEILQAAHAAAHRPFAETPVRAAPEVVATAVAAVQSQQSGEEPTPEFRVTSIIAARSGAAAIINGRVWRLNDADDAGWTLIRVDRDAGEVELSDAKGRRVVSRLREER